ncbi:hypothetical protein BCR37DRAFT_68701 [Protomyces lactucae-debilis]|uniref:DUF5672 domain-containing protein n=1 Tax=Protomyces lactucae-debilis TaxID=2754530 RepID=A0A1Y2FAG9_PROLT|nr:uncharacterized protein BCR37DRAFT_68701 [Protomyces lactucae-debilis]ORY80444.1 hypothetical protein BCR37DRAFT_68701 [Protomyces lactucae-debilis]
MSAHAFVAQVSDNISTGYAKLSTRALTRYIAVAAGLLTIFGWASYTLSPSDVYSQIPGLKSSASHVLGPEQYLTDGTSIRLNYTKVATIIELRDLPHLSNCLLNYLTVAPKDWPVVAWLSEDNIRSIQEAPLLQPDIRSGRLNLTIMPPESIVDGGDALSHFLTQPWFWHQFHPLAEWMLFFQEDSVLCSRSTDSIDNWLGFDWVGGNTFWSRAGKGANGGLSMRKLSTIKFITEHMPNTFNTAEDVFYMERMLSLQHDDKEYTDVPFPGEIVFPIDRHLNQAAEVSLS